MEITLDSPLDMHLHLREGAMLQQVAIHSAQDFSGAVIMPNLLTPITNLSEVTAYKEQIISRCQQNIFTPYMTLFLQRYSKEELLGIRDNIIGIKLYPAGITTQSENGTRDFETIAETLQHMSDLDIPLLVHGESNGFVMDRERKFLIHYKWLAENFPQLTIVMEHITSADSLETLDQHHNLFATITLHHLLITLDDVAGGLLQPDLFCKPIAKTPKDLMALQHAVFSGHPKIMFGSDSAPHPRHKKECCGCAAGIFTSPIALPMLTELFEDHNKLEYLQDFVSSFAQKIYKITPPQKQIRLRKEPWIVPEIYGEVKPFMAGRTMRWKVVR